MNYEHVHKLLEEWLNTKRPDYNDGLAILMSYEDKPMLCKQLQQYRNPDKLYESLMKLFTKVKEKNSNPVPEKKEVKQILQEVRKNPGDVPKDKVLRDLHYQSILCIKEIDSLKGTLFMLGRNPATESTMPLSDNDIKQRLAVAKMLMAANERHKKIAAAKDYYLSTGEVPVLIESNAPVEVSGDYKEQENCRKQISKLRGKINNANVVLKDANEAKRLTLLTNINVWESKLKAEEKRLELIKSTAHAIESN